MNIAFVIVDRETTPRDRNWCITMSWSLPLLQKLVPANLFESINLCQPDSTTDPIEAGKYGIAIRDGSTGKVKIRNQFPGIRRVNHKKTKHHLSQGLPVHYGKQLVDIAVGPDDDEVTAHFADGTQETGTIIVGADGGISQVRRRLLGDAAAQEVLPCQFMNFSFSLPAELAQWLEKSLGPTIEVGAHPRNMYMGLSLLDKPDTTKPETWLFYILAAWKLSDNVDGQGSGSQLSELRSRMDDWADPFKTVVEKLPDDTYIKQDQLRIWHTKPWDNHQGRVTLIGDAAHR
jgi:2-polyprenyl-6-methoxyphenol hydroxylase-like FAD-dependent oxidoreductase